MNKEVLVFKEQWPTGHGLDRHNYCDTDNGRYTIYGDYEKGKNFKATFLGNWEGACTLWLVGSTKTYGSAEYACNYHNNCKVYKWSLMEPTLAGRSYIKLSPLNSGREYRVYLVDKSMHLALIVEGTDLLPLRVCRYTWEAMVVCEDVEEGREHAA